VKHARLEESDRFTARQTLRLFGRALRYAAPLRGRLAVKVGLTLLSLAPLLVLPWPGKILIDHVIEQKPLAPALERFPMFVSPLLGLLVDADWTTLLLWTLAAQLLFVLLAGVMGSTGSQRDETSAWMSQGHDTATRTENAANAGFSFAGGVLGLFDFRYTIRLTQALNHHYRSRLFERIQSLSMPTFEDERIGDAVYRVMYDTPSITEVCYRIVITPIVVPIALATFAFTIRAVYPEHPTLFWAALLSGPVVFVITFPFSGLLRATGDRSRKAGAQTTSTLEEGVSNVLAVQSLGTKGRERERFDRDSWGSFSRYRTLVLAGMVTFLVALVPAVVIVREVFLQIVDSVIDGTLTKGDLLPLFGYFLTIFLLSMELGSIWIRLQATAAGLHRVFFLMDLEGESGATGRRPLEGVRESLRLEGVGFAYDDGTEALVGVDLEAKVGCVTALVGPAGAGKTTLVYTIPRFIEPQRGRVLIDGVDAREFSRDSLRSRVAFVFQESQLFDGSIEENIRLGNPDASELEVRRAAQSAGADDFIRALPEAYETRLGRAGAKLSVGQKQRIAIARALVRDAPILILDEPTSALDPETERRLIAALREAARTRVVFVIAHRLSTIRAAEQILFLEQGRILERGTHAELMARAGGAYRHFVDLQTRGRDTGS
jgi:ABC-type multidrug transport system fused ATPase/permease subunit